MEITYMFLLVAGYIPPSMLAFNYLVDAIPFPESETLANWLFLPIVLFITVASMLWPLTAVVVSVNKGRGVLKAREAKRLQQIDDDCREVMRLINE